MYNSGTFYFTNPFLRRKKTLTIKVDTEKKADILKIMDTQNETQKAEKKSILDFLDGEFTTKQLAAAKTITYVTASQRVKKGLTAGKLVLGKKQRLEAGGRSTQFYKKVNASSSTSQPVESAAS